MVFFTHFIFIAVLLFSGCSTSHKSEPHPAESKIISNESDSVELDHKSFVINYSKSHRLASWVKYRLRKGDLNGPGRRPKRFKSDSVLKAMGIPAVTHEDYTNSGYSRGHLAPAEDFSRSQEAIESTFIMSNVIPQKSSVNSGAWAQLEKQVRAWACGEEEVTVITGPVLTPNLEKLKGTGISVPQEFFKIIIDETPPTKAIAFKYNQTEKNQTLEKSKVSYREFQNQKNLGLAPTPESQLSEWKACR